MSIFERIRYKRFLIVAVMHTDGNLVAAVRQQSFWFRFMAVRTFCEKYFPRNYVGAYMTVQYEIWPSSEWMDRPACLNHRVFCFSCEGGEGCIPMEEITDVV